MAAEHLNDANFEQAVASGVTLVDFFATWCGPCKMLGPIIEEIAAESDGSYKVYKVDIDECEDTALDMGIMSVPTVVIFQNGAEIERVVGVRPKAELVALLKEVIG